MKSKTCCFSGHRKIPSTLISDIYIETEKAIETLIKEGYCYFGSGGALGFDTIAAISVIKLRKKYPFIRLILVLPCLSQTRNWRFEDKQIYEKIKIYNPLYIPFVSNNYQLFREIYLFRVYF
mgnify:CR=1 FL=1